MKRTLPLALALLACSGLASCKDDGPSAAGADSTPANDAPDASAVPGSSYDGTIAKPGAPFSVSYKMIGTPIVGSPVTIDLLVTSTLGSEPVTVSYRINDASAMMFHEAQPAQVRLAPAANEDFIRQQVTVVPQREGRLYLNVAASVETESGSVSSMMAIPIQVGSAGRKLEENGELQLDDDGEAVRVLTPE
ncbi:MAG: hypothetical protein KJO01_02280 [Gammaproteobacteria bacterium]|nr:hypothetical protein [Gammaproteobacteria bacterium]MBT8110473.1 hypothetical protein [Gammaproteobacteria bacterium]NND46380.1 hypothetical protein [Woeseiaceae bacterium]NNL45173.1 hypothetical protein [Woeseiaceae bacterium]